jgi:hypothetical protein
MSPSVDRRGVEPRLPGCKPSVLPLNEQPVCFERSVRGSNPVPLLTTEVCCRNTYRPSSDPGWTRTIVFLAVDQASSPLDHGILFVVTEVGIEPTESPSSRPGRFTCLRTPSRRVRGSHPAGEALWCRLGTRQGHRRVFRPSRCSRPQACKKTSLSTGPPASWRPRYRTGLTCLMGAGWAPAVPPIQVAKGRVELPRPHGHDVLSVACLPVPPLGHVSDADGNRTRVGEHERLAATPASHRARFVSPQR